MRILAVLAALAVVYVLYARQNSAKPELEDAIKSQTGEMNAVASPEAHSVYKRALDRANSVVGQVQKQRQEDSF